MAAILAMDARGQTPTHGALCRKLRRGKRAISESLRRLEEERWVERDPERRGCKRAIRFARPLRAIRAAVEKRKSVVAD